MPILLEKRDEAIHRLQARGLGASCSFTYSLNQYKYLQGIVPSGSYPGAEYFATHLMTLPTHEYVTKHDIDEMVSVIVE